MDIAGSTCLVLVWFIPDLSLLVWWVERSSDSYSCPCHFTLWKNSHDGCIIFAIGYFSCLILSFFFLICIPLLLLYHNFVFFPPSYILFFASCLFNQRNSLLELLLLIETDPWAVNNAIDWQRLYMFGIGAWIIMRYSVEWIGRSYKDSLVWLAGNGWWRWGRRSLIRFWMDCRKKSEKWNW